MLLRQSSGGPKPSRIIPMSQQPSSIFLEFEIKTHYLGCIIEMSVEIICLENCILTIHRIVDYAIKNARQGEAYEYLTYLSPKTGQSHEATLRNKFIAFADESKPNQQTMEGTLQDLNAFYNTRYASNEIAPFSRILINALDEFGWVGSKPPMLMNDTHVDTSYLADFVQSVLRSAADDHLKRPYSLLTKWLHFRYPLTFVIYDSQAALSIQEWSYFTYPLSDISCGNQYQCDKTMNTSGSGYKALLDFYQTCWLQSDEQQRQLLRQTAEDLSRKIGAYVSNIDVIDKTLWLASGDPRKLGLL